ncbi:MAG: hypothetical protein A2X08_06575 [Bacteroidetes bacterium GWA2_32_17]|nr:MAG: hypothetical protein A2X08_06575 [Bacteroidetes bacterium GWA2_32_17]
MVHIGQKIKKIVNEQRIPVKEFASKINKSRTVVYNIFERKTIDTGLLDKIGIVLKHNFFQYYINEEEFSIAKDEGISYLKKDEEISVLRTELQKNKKDITELNEKLELMKKINSLLEEKLNGKNTKKYKTKGQD